MVYHPKNGEYKYAPKINHAIPQTNSSIFFEHATYFIHNLALTITLVFSAFVFFQKKKPSRTIWYAPRQEDNKK